MVDSSSNVWQKITDIAKHIGDLFSSQDEEFKKTLGQAGTIGELVIVGINIYNQIQQERLTEEGKAFNSLFKVIFKVIFKAAKQSLSHEGMDSISIKSAKSEKIKEQLFKIFTEKKGGNVYLPNHPTVGEFRNFICQILKNEGHINLVRNFVFEFNISLDNIIDENDEDFKPLKKWFSKNQSLKELLNHLEYCRSLFYTFNPSDGRYLAEYYIENKAVFAKVPTEWEEEDEYFVKYDDESFPFEFKVRKYNSSELVMDKAIKSDMQYTIVGAPFGIGKTSLSIYLTFIIASKYLEATQEVEDLPIPIFVPLNLLGELNTIDENGTSLEEKLKQISPGGSSKNRKIILICDGLDEYGGDIKELKQKLENLRKSYQNMRFIITTRLEAGIPLKFGISSYIRLLPFNDDQVDEFFRKYGLPELNHQSLEGYKLNSQEISKPLFCWMFATMINSKFYDHSLSRESSNPKMTKALIYKGFIHSIIRGKHRSGAIELSLTQFYDDEKRILRKVAALLQMNEPKILTASMVKEQLKYYFGEKYSEKKLQEQIIEPILTSYFYLQGQTTTDKRVDFIHKSFREFLLAEYYIESIISNKKHYLRTMCLEIG
jgi:hypothetical protein